MLQLTRSTASRTIGNAGIIASELSERAVVALVALVMQHSMALLMVRLLSLCLSRLLCAPSPL